jgi:hypothetical protein
VFDGVRMVQISRFEKFLEMVLRLSYMVLEVMLGSRDKLLIGAVRFLVVVVAAGSDCDPSGVPLLPLLATLSTFAGGFGWRFPGATEDHFPIVQNKDNPNRLLARGVLGGDIKQLLGGVHLITVQHMH